MVSDLPAGRAGDFDRLMTRLVQQVPHTSGAVLLSADGLVRAVYGLDADSADHIAALAAGLCALGRSASTRFGDGGTVRRIVVELDTALLFVSTAALGTCLAVLAEPGADAARLGYEMALLSRGLGPSAAPGPPQPATAGEVMRSSESSGLR